ncbi:MAG: hypothetical protein ABIS51_14625, partial [Sphingomonas sp.]
MPDGDGRRQQEQGWNNISLAQGPLKKFHSRTYLPETIQPERVTPKPGGAIPMHFTINGMA